MRRRVRGIHSSTADPRTCVLIPGDAARHVAVGVHGSRGEEDASGQEGDQRALLKQRRSLPPRL